MKKVWIFTLLFIAFSTVNAKANESDTSIDYESYAAEKGLTSKIEAEDVEIEIEVERRERPHRRQGYFDWARGRNGFGYCYEFARNGRVLNNGRPVNNRHCERRKPSFYDWARGQNGYIYCYQFTPYGVVMNEGRAVANRMCRR